MEHKLTIENPNEPKPKPRRLTKAERRANARRNITELRIEWEQKMERLKQNQQL